jgi:hypothetical protein
MDLRFLLFSIVVDIFVLLLGAASIMVARGAMWNASIFCAKGKTPWEDVKREYVRKVFNFTVVFVRGYPIHFAWVRKHTETSMSVYQKLGVMCSFFSPCFSLMGCTASWAAAATAHI